MLYKILRRRTNGENLLIFHAKHKSRGMNEIAEGWRAVSNKTEGSGPIFGHRPTASAAKKDQHSKTW